MIYSHVGTELWKVKTVVGWVVFSVVNKLHKFATTVTSVTTWRFFSLVTVHINRWSAWRVRVFFMKHICTRTKKWSVVKKGKVSFHYNSVEILCFSQVIFYALNLHCWWEQEYFLIKLWHSDTRFHQVVKVFWTVLNEMKSWANILRIHLSRYEQ